MIDQEAVHAATPFARTLDIAFPALAPAEVRAVMPWVHERSTIGGGTHGGALMALADVAATVCAWLNVPEGSGTVTTQSSSSFLRPLTGEATAHARPLRAGRSVVAVDVDVLDDRGRLCVRVHQIQSVVPAPA
jgi:1,4-dihydroxy-2-naphthoyl-CoA hydrolase